MADSLFNLQVKRILARSTHHLLSMQIEATAMPFAAFRISSQFYSIAAPFCLCYLLFLILFHFFFYFFFVFLLRLQPESSKMMSVFARVAFSKFKSSKWMVAGRDLGAVKGGMGRGRYRYAGCAFNAQWQLLLSCCLPLGKNVWTTSEAE